MLSKGKIKIIIFDFDGVIVESNHIKDKAFDVLFKRYPEAYEDLWSYHRNYVSVSRYQKFDYLLGRINQTGNQELKETLLKDFSRIILELMQQVTFVKGAKEFLVKQHQQIPLYLASVTPADDLAIILDHLQIRSYFKNVYGCPPWTKPQAINDILEKEITSSDQTVLVGDSYGDQRAAKETGIHFIGRNSGLLFENPQPQHIIADLTSLTTFLQN